MVDREVLVESAAALSGVAVFIAFLLIVGSSGAGATQIVAGIALFIVLMSALGWWLSTKF